MMGSGDPDSAELDETEHQKAWRAFEAVDALAAKAQFVRSMPPPSTVAELRKREQLIADLVAQADAVMPPPANTGKPIPEPVFADALLSLGERFRGVGVPAGAESPTERRNRRATRFGLLGGRLENRGGSWLTVGRRGALADLVREEQAVGRPMSDKSDVRADLIAALGG